MLNSPCRPVNIFVSISTMRSVPWCCIYPRIGAAIYTHCEAQFWTKTDVRMPSGTRVIGSQVRLYLIFLSQIPREVDTIYIEWETNNTCLSRTPVSYTRHGYTTGISVLFAIKVRSSSNDVKSIRAVLLSPAINNIFSSLYDFWHGIVVASNVIVE